MEIWDLYDSQGQLTGEQIQRGEVLPADRFHLVIHFWLINAEGLFLIQQRSQAVEQNKGAWSITGGSAIAGETSEDAVIREVEEELGYRLQLAELHKVHSYQRRDYFVDVYCLVKEVPISGFSPGVEVSQIKYTTKEQLLAMRSAGLFWNMNDLYFKKIFDVHQSVKP